MVCKNRVIYGFMSASWVVITMPPRDRTWSTSGDPLFTVWITLIFDGTT